MSLSAKDKLALRRQSKRKITPTGLYLYHPASDRWIPAQADEEGRLVIDPSDLDTRYHKKNEDVDLVADSLLTSNFAISEKDSNFLKLANRAKTEYRGWWLKWIWVESEAYLVYVKPALAALGLSLRSYNNTEVAKIEAGAAVTEFSIPKAGDIIPIAGKDLGSIANSFSQIHGNYISAYNKIVGPSLDIGFVWFVPISIAPEKPETGYVYFDEDDGKLKVWTGAAWETISSA